MKNVNKILLAGAVVLGFTAAANTEASADSYTVRQGDTIWGLAQANGVTIDDIDALNPEINKDTHLIIVGDTITLPDSTVTLPDVDTTVETVTAPVETPVQITEVQAQPAVSEPVQATELVATTATAPVAPTTSSAKDIIASRESGGDYNAQNGRYVGKFQLDAAYLNGDYSPANQERVADNYVSGRYGSWDNALAFWNANGWY